MKFTDGFWELPPGVRAHLTFDLILIFDRSITKGVALGGVFR